MKTWFETSNKDIEKLISKALNLLLEAEDKTGYKVKKLGKVINILQEIDFKKELAKQGDKI